MNTIDTIIIHCSATKAGWDYHAKDIDRWHREQGFQCIGYHWVITLDGDIEQGRPETMTGAHCKGWNERSIGICYVGGVDAAGRPTDTRTKWQKLAMHKLVLEIMDRYPTITRVIGHRDTSPDLNGDGVITANEWIKACPCFDVRAEFPIGYCVANKANK